MLDPEKSSQGAVPIAGQEPDPIIRVDEVDGLGADVKDAEHAGLNAELPFAVEEGLVSVNGEGFAEIGGEDSVEIQALSELPIDAGKVRPAGIGMKRGKQGAVREPLRTGRGDGRLDGI